jgi:putative ATPase
MNQPGLFEGTTPQPLAARLRPHHLDQFFGQSHVVGEGTPLRQAIESGDIPSMILWGPPGCGKTTLANIIAHFTEKNFEAFSAVTEGVPRVREIIKEAKNLLIREGRGTILFCDEIHRFNKGQQDAFLPFVEDGTITLIGATTENPSFELNSALLSRLKVYVLNSLDSDAIGIIARRGAEQERVDKKIDIGEDALSVIARYSDGDGRRALNAVETLFKHLPDGVEVIDDELVRAVLDRRMPRYDKDGEDHYNQISALHKAVRGSDVEGTLYWLARMLSAGEDGLYVARRLVRMATEDIGLADPRALSITIAAKEAYHFQGPPEGELALAEAAIYLATAPKSNKVYEAWASARKAASEHPNEPVPMHVRNASTKLMKELGYGDGYKYDPAEEDGVADQSYLPEKLKGSNWYEPTGRGYEKTVAERLEWFKTRRDSDGVSGAG